MQDEERHSKMRQDIARRDKKLQDEARYCEMRQENAR